MSEQKEGGFFSQLKNQIVTTLGLIITAAGGLVIANMEAIFGVNEPEVETVAQVEQKEEPTKDTLVIIQKVDTPKTTQVPSVEKKEPEEKEYDW
jgi:hypothetical protein